MTVLAASLAVLILLSLFIESDRSMMMTMSLGTGVDVSTYHGLRKCPAAVLGCGNVGLRCVTVTLRSVEQWTVIYNLPKHYRFKGNTRHYQTRNNSQC